MKIFKAVHVHGGDLIDEVFARIGAENFNLGWQDFCKSNSVQVENDACLYFVKPQKDENRQYPPFVEIDHIVSQVLKEAGFKDYDEVYIDFIQPSN